MKVSMTTFVDFVCKTGTPKLTVVKTSKKAPAYDPALDYWKQLRDGLVDFHKAGLSKGQLSTVTASVKDAKRLARYPACLLGYRKFLGKKTVKWFKPPSAVWGPTGIEIRVNPELGLIINGKRHVVKLYFKADSLSKRRIEVVLLLMSQALQGVVKPGTEFAILDVPQGKLYSSATPNLVNLPLLYGEAASFRTIWKQV